MQVSVMPHRCQSLHWVGDVFEHTHILLVKANVLVLNLDLGSLFITKSRFFFVRGDLGLPKSQIIKTAIPFLVPASCLCSSSLVIKLHPPFSSYNLSF